MNGIPNLGFSRAVDDYQAVREIHCSLFDEFDMQLLFVFRFFLPFDYGLRLEPLALTEASQLVSETTGKTLAPCVWTKCNEILGLLISLRPSPCHFVSQAENKGSNLSAVIK